MNSGNRNGVYKYYVPLLILPAFNLIQMAMLNYKAALCCGVNEVLFLLIWASAEEIVFRKAVPYILEKWTRLKIEHRCLAEAAMFALAHLLNLSREPFAGTLIVQMLLAFGVGYVFAVLVKLNNDITLCILVHFLLNITGSAETSVGIPLFIDGIWVALSAACAAYGYFILCKKSTNLTG